MNLCDHWTAQQSQQHTRAAAHLHPLAQHEGLSPELFDLGRIGDYLSLLGTHMLVQTWSEMRS